MVYYFLKKFFINQCIRVLTICDEVKFQFLFIRQLFVEFDNLL